MIILPRNNPLAQWVAFDTRPWARDFKPGTGGHRDLERENAVALAALGDDGRCLPFVALAPPGRGFQNHKFEGSRYFELYMYDRSRDAARFVGTWRDFQTGAPLPFDWRAFEHFVEINDTKVSPAERAARMEAFNTRYFSDCDAANKEGIKVGIDRALQEATTPVREGAFTVADKLVPSPSGGV